VREVSNSWVKKRGGGVGVGAGVEVGSGVGETGTGVGEAGIVAVGGMSGSGVGVAGWQAEMKRRHPIRRNFFMAFLIT
jgi:hypothetical protein